MNSYLRFLLLAVFCLGVAACGGGGGGEPVAGNPNPPADPDPTDPDDPDPVDPDGFLIKGTMPDYLNDPSIRLWMGDQSYAGTGSATGTYEIPVPDAALVGDYLARIEILAGTVRLHVPLAPADSLEALAGSDRLLTNADLPGVNVTEVAAANYAVLFRANGERHPALLADLETLRRDSLDGDISLQLAAAIRLHGRDNNALPTGVIDTWDLVTDYTQAASFLDAAREPAIPKSGARQAKAEEDAVESTVQELLSESAQTVPFVSTEGAPPFGFYRMTTISRDLDNKRGLLINLTADGGTYRNAGGHDELDWEIDAEGRLTITPLNGAPVYRGGEDPVGPFEVRHTTEKVVFTRLSDGEFADMLYAEFYEWAEFTDAAHMGMNPPKPAELEPVGRAVIAVTSGGAIAWETDEPIGAWALPGVLSGPDQLHAADVPVKTDDLYQFSADGRGTALLSGEEFSWQFQGAFADTMAGVLVNFDENGSGVTFYRLREDRGAFDIANAAAATDPGTGLLKKAVNGSLGFKKDPLAAFAVADVEGVYRLFGDGNAILDTLAAFDMAVDAGNAAQFFSTHEDASVTSSMIYRWDVDAEGRLIISQRFDRDAITGEPASGNHQCVDENACIITHERMLILVRTDDVRHYVIEKQERFALDNAQPFSKGDVAWSQIQIRYWDKMPVPE